MKSSDEVVEESAPIAFLIGTLDREGVLSALKTSGRTYAIRRIDSSVANWESICRQLAREPVACVLLKLTGATYQHLCREEYAEARDRLFGYIAAVPHAVYVYEGILWGQTQQVTISDDLIEDGEDGEDEDEYFRSYFTIPPEEQRVRVNAMLAERGIQPVPYGNNAELTTLASDFIGQVEQGLVFRIYIPTSQIWARETDRMLALFRDYLANIGHPEVVLNQRRTTRGTIYEFFSSKNGPGQGLPSSSLSAEFGEFSRLLDLCITDGSKAERMLREKCVGAREINAMLTRFSKEARRLHVDLRQEREQKLLSIRHRLESELSELVSMDFSSLEIARLVDAAVPAVEGIGSALVGGHQAIQLAAAQGGTVTVNIRPQFVQAVNAIVASEINGDVHLTSEDRSILDLVRKHAPEREGELSSAVRELADDSVPAAQRIGAKQRLKAFLIQLGSKVPDVAAGLLQAYLENRLNL